MKKMWSLSFVMMTIIGLAQNNNEERIARDIEIAENVLSTLIKQQLDRRSNFWMADVKGSYTSGFGVTLRVPYDNISLSYTISTADAGRVWSTPDVVGFDNGVVIDTRTRDSESEKNKENREKEKLKVERAARRDSARDAYGDKLLEASKNFLADYGDLLSIEPNERILITTKSERGRNYAYAVTGDFRHSPNKMISVEANKGDLTQYKQGKITRDQLMSKFKIINNVVNEESYPDLELLSTIFNRLYKSDLSTTYFVSSTPYYERIKDFGVTFYMQVYSSNGAGDKRWNMPTANLEDLDQATRDKKVIELYPKFEKDLKENIVEYGRTLTSLKDDEMLIFDVTLTKCTGCGIPSTIELSVKAGVLKEYSSGKISRNDAAAKVNLKKGPEQ